MSRVAVWLKSQGFEVQRVARSRTWIQFRGTAQKAEKAFHTQIHQYLANGKLHYANSSDPSIPAGLSGIVLGLRGLNNYRLQPRNRLRSAGPRDTTGQGQHQMAPDDFATVYDVAPLYTDGIDGTGQNLVIVGQTDIDVSDIDAFRKQFSLPPINLQQILVAGQADPGISETDLPEADLDLEWSGAVARGANIIFVYSGDVFTSVQDAIDQYYAPVISMSYGLCEGANLMELPLERQMALQANSEGITWVAAAGDDGAASCEDQNATIAEDGLAVDAPASVPEVTSMGGSEFNEGIGAYWSSDNTATLGLGALIHSGEGVERYRVWQRAGGGWWRGERVLSRDRCGKPARASPTTVFAMFRIFPSRRQPITMATLSTPAASSRFTEARRWGRPLWPGWWRCSISIWLPAALRSLVRAISTRRCIGWRRVRREFFTILRPAITACRASAARPIAARASSDTTPLRRTTKPAAWVLPTLIT